MLLICLFALARPGLMAQNQAIEVIEDTPALRVERIDSVTFFAARKRVHPKPQLQRQKITDLEEVKRRLAPRGFKFDEQRIVYPKTGRFYKRFCENFAEMAGAYPDPDLGFILGYWNEYCYYLPDDDVMFIHSDDDDTSYNFRTGDQGEDVGEPRYWIDSPTGLYRLNSQYGGIAWGSSYFYIQKRIASQQYRSIGRLPFGTNGDLEEPFWEGDKVLYIIDRENCYDWLEDEDKYRITRLSDNYWRVRIK